MPTIDFTDEAKLDTPPPAQYPLHVQVAPSRAFAIRHWARHPFGGPTPFGPHSPDDHRDVRLFDDRIGWTFNGISHDRALDDIGLVRLCGAPTFMCLVCSPDPRRSRRLATGAL
jgi:hypothetical protein